MALNTIIKIHSIAFPFAPDLDLLLPTDAKFIAVNYNTITNTIDLYYQTNPDVKVHRHRFLRIVSSKTKITLLDTMVYIGSVFTQDYQLQAWYDFHVYEDMP